ncbi:hypothetical protein [Sodalis sp. C49]|uniref:hypothetical protein n=1 Tax=unclassified Sodalis (in: enterobacteria) TaxID=2636512 RepID=UPI003965B540
MLRFPLSVSSPFGLSSDSFPLPCDVLHGAGRWRRIIGISTEAATANLPNPNCLLHSTAIPGFIPSFAQTYPQMIAAGKNCRASRNRFRYNSRKFYRLAYFIKRRLFSVKNRRLIPVFY